MRLKRSLRLSPNSLSLPKLSLKPILFLLVALSIIYIAYQAFLIRTITCQTESLPCPEEILNIFQPLKGHSFLTLQTAPLTESLKDKFPIDDISYSLKLPQTLAITIKGWQEAHSVSLYQLTPLPTLSMDAAYQSSASASWQKPSLEIANAIKEMTPQFAKLWRSGQQNPDSTSEGQIAEVYTDSPSQEALIQLYSLFDLANKYLENPRITLFGSRVFLSQENQPDIIIYIPTDLVRVESALQSIGKLYTIKQDAKVIDLSFKHPILK